MVTIQQANIKIRAITENLNRRIIEVNESPQNIKDFGKDTLGFKMNGSLYVETDQGYRIFEDRPSIKEGEHYPFATWMTGYNILSSTRSDSFNIRYIPDISWIPEEAGRIKIRESEIQNLRAIDPKANLQGEIYAISINDSGTGMEWKGVVSPSFQGVITLYNKVLEDIVLSRKLERIFESERKISA